MVWLRVLNSDTTPVPAEPMTEIPWVNLYPCYTLYIITFFNLNLFTLLHPFDLIHWLCALGGVNWALSYPDQYPLRIHFAWLITCLWTCKFLLGTTSSSTWSCSLLLVLQALPQRVLSLLTIQKYVLWPDLSPEHNQNLTLTNLEPTSD